MKNTIFGKVVGDTLFNLLKLGELETDPNERPLYPAEITKVTIISNPFDDIIPRDILRRKEIEEIKKREDEEKAKAKGTKLKKYSLIDD